MTLRISDDLALPVDAVTETFGILAMKRVGKTYLASVMAEEMVAAKLPFVALDPTGAWWGLRASAAGDPGAGLPVVILGGEHGDLPLEPAAGALVADLVVDHPGYYVLDLGLFDSNAQQDRFAMEFAERLYRRKARSRTPVHLFIDEADAFIPQQPMPDQRRMLGAFDTLVRRGGIRGIGVTLITQRGAVINKNVLSQVGTLFALRTMGVSDREAIEAWMRGHGSKEQVRGVLDTLASLPKGEAWVWSPAWLGTFKRVRVRERRTFNSSATPEAGAARLEPRKLHPVDLEVIRDRMAEALERQKADDPAALRREVARLRAELARAGAPVAAAERVVEVEVPDKEADRRLRALMRALAEQLDPLMAAADRLAKEAQNLRERHERLVDGHLAAGAPREDPRPAPRRVEVRDPRPVAASPEGLDDAKRRVLDVAATLAHRGIRRDAESVARWLGLHPRGGGFRERLARLREWGFMEGFELTDAGARLAEPLPPGPNAALAACPTEGARRALACLLDALGGPGHTMPVEQLAKRLDLHPRGGGFRESLARLRQMGVVTDGGPVGLTEGVFR